MVGTQARHANQGRPRPRGWVGKTFDKRLHRHTETRCSRGPCRCSGLPVFKNAKQARNTPSLTLALASSLLPPPPPLATTSRSPHVYLLSSSPVPHHTLQSKAHTTFTPSLDWCLHHQVVGPRREPLVIIVPCLPAHHQPPPSPFSSPRPSIITPYQPKPTGLSPFPLFSKDGTFMSHDRGRGVGCVVVGGLAALGCGSGGLAPSHGRRSIVTSRPLPARSLTRLASNQEGGQLVFI